MLKVQYNKAISVKYSKIVEVQNSKIVLLLIFLFNVLFEIFSFPPPALGEMAKVWPTVCWAFKDVVPAVIVPTHYRHKDIVSAVIVSTPYRHKDVVSSIIVSTEIPGWLTKEQFTNHVKGHGFDVAPEANVQTARLQGLFLSQNSVLWK